MPFTLVHGLVPYFIACLFTKDKRLRLLAFIAGMLPDLDGIPILFNMDLYYLIHHELFHAPIYGLVLAIPVALVLGKYFKMNRVKTGIVFAASFALHSVTDVFFTNWYVRLLWPFSLQKYSLALSDWGLVLTAIVAVLLLAQGALFIGKQFAASK